MIEPPDFVMLRDKYDLCILKAPTDLQLASNGGLGLSNRKTLSLGTPYFDALLKFVTQWQTNAPIIHTLFELFQTNNARAKELQDLENKLAQENADAMVRNEAPPHNLAESRYRSPSAVIASSTVAGTILITVNTLLTSLRDDLRGAGLWENQAPKIAGFSVGRIIEAGSNNFRHYEEWQLHWVTHGVFSGQQMASIRILKPVIQEFEDRMYTVNLAPRVLSAIASDYESFQEMVFNFVKHFSEKCERAKTVPKP